MHEAAQADYDTCGLVRPPTLLLKVIFRSSGTGRQQDIQTRLKLNENSSLLQSTVYDDSGRSCEKDCTWSRNQQALGWSQRQPWTSGTIRWVTPKSLPSTPHPNRRSETLTCPVRWPAEAKKQSGRNSARRCAQKSRSLLASLAPVQVAATCELLISKGFDRNIPHEER